jgi:membrane dipeptidase
MIGGASRRLSRRAALLGGSAALLYLGRLSDARAQDAAARTALARDVIARTTTVDMHSHAGGILGSRAQFYPVAEPMRQGGLAIVCLAAVSDSPTHHVVDKRIRPFRDPAPGELYAWTQSRFRRIRELVQAQDLAVVKDRATLEAARDGHPSVIVATEGSDFLEGQIDRIDEAYERWHVRHMQLTHYRPNELGDIQTEPRVHGGLTDFGAEVIRRCNHRGIVVDIAHAPLELVKRAADVTTKPLILSHTALSASPSTYSRLITAEHARVVAGTGGVVGVWPARFSFVDLAAMVNGFARMADVAGVDHVGLGTDMLGIVGGAVFENYDRLPELAELMLKAGFGPTETGKILGGNYRRVFEATIG